MNQIQKTFIKHNTKISDLILENHFILLLLEHFEIDFTVNNKTVEDISSENNINPEVFIALGNIYNGFSPQEINNITTEDISRIIKVLKNTHLYYKKDKYPEIRKYIKDLNNKNNSAEILLIEKFFNEYFDEVVEHLDYEDDIAFPYFTELLKKIKDKENGEVQDFSVITYKDHHTDIESKLADLKNLLLKHINLKNDLSLRRKLLFSLFELEFDLKAHSMIEEKILIPAIRKFENIKNA